MDTNKQHSEGAAFKIIVDQSGTWSIWFAHREAPAGWEDTGFLGDQEACIKRIIALNAEQADSNENQVAL